MFSSLQCPLLEHPTRMANPEVKRTLIYSSFSYSCRLEDIRLQYLLKDL